MSRRKERQHFENIDHGMEKDRKKGGKKTEGELIGRLKGRTRKEGKVEIEKGEKKKKKENLGKERLQLHVLNEKKRSGQETRKK